MFSFFDSSISITETEYLQRRLENIDAIISYACRGSGSSLSFSEGHSPTSSSLFVKLYIDMFWIEH